MYLRRTLEAPIRMDLNEKMVFLAGPRQVGKTTLARHLLDSSGPGIYLNWDNREDRREIRAARWPGDKALLVFDELHKWSAWKGWIKGEFDKHRDRLRFLVTGSARLDIYRRGGDSLQGRYHHYRLHPLSYSELMSVDRSQVPVPGGKLPIPTEGNQDTVQGLFEYGGFPEPYLAQSARTLRRWQKERLERFFREDVRDLESIRDLSSLQLLADLLPDHVSSLFSLNSIREDLEVSHRALKHWMDILDRLYYVFRVRPFSSSRIRSLQKMPKIYLWDTSLVSSPGPRFENLIALHLLKFVHYLQDCEGYDVELYYLRDKAGHEVDFLVAFGKKPWFAVEAKLSASGVNPSLAYFQQKLKIPWVYQVVMQETRDVEKDGVRSLPAHQFLGALI